MKAGTLALVAATFTALAAMTAAANAQSAADAANPAGAAPQAQNGGDADGAFMVTGKFSEPDGEKLYRRVCAACHMSAAEGAEGAGMYPALASNPKLASGSYPAYVVVKGLNGMPPVGTMMTDRQVADVVNYVRTHFGNAYPEALTEAEVKALR
jgi:mono/diheme cytochrome c family protein